MSVYFQATFMKKDLDGNMHSFTALFPSCFGEILDGIDCKAVREEEREDYRVDVRTYNFDDIRKVWMPSLKKRQEEIEAEIVEMKENLVRATNRDVYAMIKEDMNFRRFLMRGKRNVTVEWNLISMAYNLLKLHHKIQNGHREDA